MMHTCPLCLTVYRENEGHVCHAFVIFRNGHIIQFHRPASGVEAMYQHCYNDAIPRLECDECGVITFDFSRLGEIHACGRQGVLRLVSPTGQNLEIHDPLPHHNID